MGEAMEGLARAPGLHLSERRPEAAGDACSCAWRCTLWAPWRGAEMFEWLGIELDPSGLAILANPIGFFTAFSFPLMIFAAFLVSGSSAA